MQVDFTNELISIRTSYTSVLNGGALEGNAETFFCKELNRKIAIHYKAFKENNDYILTDVATGYDIGFNTSFKTKEQALKWLEKTYIKNTDSKLKFIDTIKTKNTIEEHKKIVAIKKENFKKLENILKLELPHSKMIETFTGMPEIDVLKLDSMLSVPDGVSTNDFIKNKYGAEALELLTILL